MRWLLALLVLASACKREADRAQFLAKDPKPRFPSQAVLIEPGGAGEIAYLGMDAKPESPARGETVELTHYFAVKRAPPRGYDVFVHGEVPGGPRILVADHAPLFGRLTMERWQAGDVYADVHRVKIPEDVPAASIDVLLGFFADKIRWTVAAPPGGSDGRDRLKAATLRLAGEAPPDNLPIATLARAEGAIVPDGKLDEPAWQKAEVLAFSDSMGRGGQPRFPTKLRLLWDNQNLYVGFESEDADITERYKERDDPIYEHETVELFIMPNAAAPALGPYVELQASPAGIIFDACFDGPRRGMNKGWNAAQTVGTTIDGTLDDPSPDKGWVSEWVVPLTSLRGVTAAPKPGDEWRMNAFRIEKWRAGGGYEGEYTAWSPPRVGDFHNVVRFGRMRFGS